MSVDPSRRPKPAMKGDKAGVCKCGQRFTGPPNRKYCDDCSPTIKYQGRG